MKSPKIGSVLFVDDEPYILNSLRRIISGKEFKVSTANGGEQAVEILKKEHIDILITDVVMPGISGLELLEKVKEKYPDTCRIILSGYAEKESINRALVQGLATNYISKPCSAEILLETIRHSFEIKQRLNNPKLYTLMNKLELPALPETYTKFMNAIEDERPIDQIAAILNNDPSIVTIILHTVNSAFYGWPGSIRSVEQAIITLGINIIKDIVFSVSLHNSFHWHGKKRQELERLFSHSLMANKLTGHLYRHLYNERLPTEYSAIGITHDIGKLLILAHFEERYFAIQNQVSNNSGLSFYECEIEMGFSDITHSEIGGFFLDWWNLPYSLTEGALYHHTPEIPPKSHQKAITALHLADQAVEAFFYPDSYDLATIMDQETIELVQKELEIFTVNGLPKLSV